MANVDQVARALNVTPRRVQQLVKEGLPKTGHGEYEIGPCMHWYIRYLQTAMEQRGVETDGGVMSLGVERARLTREQADRAALMNAVLRGEVIRSDDATAQWSGHVVAARAKLLALPTKLGPRLIALTDVNTIAEIIKSAVYEALDELARWTPAEGSGPMEEPTEVDGESVGGQGAPVKQRVKRRTRAVED
jgi:phage terminase Nu1 subunit (DNA packaging protein)